MDDPDLLRQLGVFILGCIIGWAIFRALTR